MSDVLPAERADAPPVVAVPRYVQIAEGMIGQIEAGELRPGDKLPPERELSSQLGVNRITLRQALQVLETRGLLVRRRGDGTYIAAPKIERSAGHFFPFTAGMRGMGYAPSARVIALEQRPATAAEAEQLGLPPAAPIYYGHRLRLINQEAVMLEQFVLPAHRFPDFARHDLANRSIYEIMQTEYGVSLARARQSLEPVIATAYEAEHLGILPGAPLMLERRQTFDQQDTAVEYTKDLYRGDRFRFITDTAPVEPEHLRLSVPAHA